MATRGDVRREESSFIFLSMDIMGNTIMASVDIFLSYVGIMMFVA